MALIINIVEESPMDGWYSTN